jgi:uncharacterized DUF497 family protein
MLIFEWDEVKYQINIDKHGIPFEEAETVFADDYGLLMPDPDHSIGESRSILLGKSSQSQLLIVCHCEYIEDRIRIISARKATIHERKRYEGAHHA